MHIHVHMKMHKRIYISQSTHKNFRNISMYITKKHHMHSGGMRTRDQMNIHTCEQTLEHTPFSPL